MISFIDRSVCEDRAVIYHKTMTEKDKKIIDEANRIGYTDWGQVLDLAEKADTEEAREELRRIAIAKHHKEEASAGLL